LALFAICHLNADKVIVQRALIKMDFINYAAKLAARLKSPWDGVALAARHGANKAVIATRCLLVASWLIERFITRMATCRPRFPAHR